LDWTRPRGCPALAVAATVGELSPTGNVVGPCLAVEQVALSLTVPDAQRTVDFGRFNVTGSFATALGARSSSVPAAGLTTGGVEPVGAYRL